MVISDDLFREGSGRLKILKRDREVYAARLAETVQDPDEIWVNWVWHDKLKRWMLDRRYLRVDPETGLLAIFEWTRFGWSGITTYQSDVTQAERRRRGALLYRREK